MDFREAEEQVVVPVSKTDGLIWRMKSTHMKLVSMAGLFRTTSFVSHLWSVFSNELVSVYKWAICSQG